MPRLEAASGATLSRDSQWPISSRSWATATGIGAQRVELAEPVQRALGVAAHHRVEQLEQLQPVAQAQHRLNQLAVDRPLGGGDRLVEQRERVAHRALGGARDHRQRVGDRR